MISGSGVLFVLIFAAEWVVFKGVNVNAYLSTGFLVSLSITLLASAVILYGGYWLHRSELTPDRYPRIETWFFGGMGFYLGINAPIMAVWSPDSALVLAGWVRFTVTVGGIGGLLVGVVEARSIQRERAAERATVRAEQAEMHHQHLDYLNSLLRHEVLNTANVITGYASMVLDDADLDDDARERLETIHRQGRDMTGVIRDVKVLIAATRGTVELRDENLSAIVLAEVADLRATAESVEIEASVPADVRVEADDLLPRVFSNLLTNAVEHNDSETPRVEVIVEESAETVTVRVADNGPGIPADERDALFERSDNTGGTHGLGLYLVRTLVERYGGTVELVETGPDGTAFAVELPLSDDRAESTGGDRFVSGDRDRVSPDPA
ncbi:sensor histidine kinase [Halorussus marinus]|uniref:sensor histidine kinase n=1 Tax=Halorussus marinus TaxID=2505976 RepID=UPI001432281A|nr:HAMP domain-containing sensor histidine kinase [Halorussus marinus]